MMMNNNIRRRDLTHLGITIAVIILINLISARLFFRLDLTSEQRYTLAPVTKSFLRNVDQEILVKLYLTGDLNVGFQKLSKATREMLDEIRLASDGHLRYEMVDPNVDSKARDLLKTFEIEAVPVFEAAADGRKIQSRVYPFLLVGMKDQQTPVSLLENLPGLSGAENLNSSVESLEYKIMEAIRGLMGEEKPAVAFLEGHGELDELDVMDITDALSAYYQVDRGSLTDDPFVLDAYKTLIIAKPQVAFSQRDKFIIDQYIMRGGRVLWLIDAVNVTLDSLRRTTETMGLGIDLNLSDQLFRYGVRINHVLLQDIQSAMIPINVSAQGETPKLVPVPWLFNPLLNTALNHPVTRHVNVVRSEFVSSLDTVGQSEGMTREVLLSTGRYTNEMPVPVFITLAMVNEKPQREAFKKSFVPVAIALDGVFTSAFKNRPVPPEVAIPANRIQQQSLSNRMIVVADGDIIRNEVRLKYSGSPQVRPLGYDEMSNQTFGNKQFILNAVNYLSDDQGWMALRNRNYELRLLNKDQLANDLSFWKVLNVVAPIVVLLMAGLIIPFWRKRRFGK
jgi:ABC-2 type transport system permease protein